MWVKKPNVLRDVSLRNAASVDLSGALGDGLVDLLDGEFSAGSERRAKASAILTGESPVCPSGRPFQPAIRKGHRINRTLPRADPSLQRNNDSGILLLPTAERDGARAQRENE